MSSPEVVVVGAGPAGLVAACTLALQGVSVRVYDARQGPDDQPRALVLWAGCLEVLDRLGVGDDILEQGLVLQRARYSSVTRPLFTVGFGALAGTRFTRPVCLPQPVVVDLLLARAATLGVDVRWNHRVTEVKLDDDRAVVQVAGTTSSNTAGTPTEVTARWVVGADGSRSVVREAAGVEMEGRTFTREFLLVDGRVVSPDLPADEARYDLGPHGVLVVVPLPDGTHRVFADREIPPEGTPDTVFDDALAALRLRQPSATISDVRWASRFRVHSRVARGFRRGPVLLAGDAAHGHSPAGGQGLNTAVQDGFDLAWRIAAVSGGADGVVVDGYEAERRPAAQRAVQQADAQTKLWLVANPVRRRLRDALLRALGSRARFQQAAVGRLAQLDLGLRNSPALVEGQVPQATGLPAVGHWSGLPVPPRDELGCAVRHRLVVSGLTAQQREALAGEAPSGVLVVDPPAAGTAARPSVVWVRPDGVVGGATDWDGRGQILRLLGRRPAAGPEARPVRAESEVAKG
ncbi:FAD-dependent monooxygenase [Promicromonospora sp. NFX87]|uniref:FAD-dependent monooxygenase n=1 Tax=Promicromonospora sp. NFX87 TaxID=3402691 RepID=UPI003AFAF374